MVQALVELDEQSNRVLNIVKARHGLRDKGEAIRFVITGYVEQSGEPELKPEFVAKMQKIQRQKSMRVDDFAKRYGLKV
ncbi:DUF2683 family protein [Candidatus Woesearchaeota archaeon]|nr:DUF2683 family protein [Candidatus Woesearchaeota archaeon]